MKIYKISGIECYKSSDIKEFLSKAKWNEFMKWMRGQACIIHKGEDYIYYYDFERWRDGREPF